MLTVVEGDPKARFSLATTPCVRTLLLFFGLFNFTLDPCLIMLSVKRGTIKYHFWVFGITQHEIEPRSFRPLANTLPNRLLPNISICDVNLYADDVSNLFLEEKKCVEPIKFINWVEEEQCNRAQKFLWITLLRPFVLWRLEIPALPNNFIHIFVRIN